GGGDARLPPAHGHQLRMLWDAGAADRHDRAARQRAGVAGPINDRVRLSGSAEAASVGSTGGDSGKLRATLGVLHLPMSPGRVAWFAGLLGSAALSLFPAQAPSDPGLRLAAEDDIRERVLKKQMMERVAASDRTEKEAKPKANGKSSGG